MMQNGTNFLLIFQYELPINTRLGFVNLLSILNFQ
jgi:hypothetical protein